jgi:hypothetical protein
LGNPVDISTGQGAEEGGERGGAKAAVKVGDEAGLGKTAEGEECSVSGGRGNGDGGDGEKPQVGGGRLGAGEEGKSGGGRLKDRDRSGSEDGEAVRAKERRQTNERMRESKVRQEIAGYRRGFIREGEVTCEVRRATHLQDRAVGQSKWDEGKGLGSEERLERREVGKTEEDPSTARVCNERGSRRERSKGRGRCGGEGLRWRDTGEEI